MGVKGEHGPSSSIDLPIGCGIGRPGPVLGVLATVVLLVVSPVRAQFASLVEFHGAVVGHGIPGMVISPDGSSVYLTFADSDVIGVYARNGVTGALSVVEGHRDGLAGVTGIDRPGGAVMSPDGANVYLIGIASNTIVVASRDAMTGALTFEQVLAQGDPALGSFGPPRRLALSPDGAHLYAADDAVLATFARDAGTGALTLLDMQPAGITAGSRMTAVIVSPDGKHIYTVTFSDDIGVWTRDALTGLPTLVQQVTLTTRSTSQAELSPDGVHLYVRHRPASYDGMAIYTRDALTGFLTLVQDEFFADDHFVFSSDGGHLYCQNVWLDRLLIYERDAVTGLLTETGFATGADIPLGGSPDGLHFYAHDFSTDLTRVFDRDSGSGALTLSGSVFAGSLDGTGGLLSADGVYVTDDGRHVYVGANNSILAFSRDAASGALSLVDQAISGVGGVTQLFGVRAMDVSPDGEHLYAIGGPVDSVVGFDRDPLTGELTFVETHLEGVAGVVGIENPMGIAVSGDGANVYVVGSDGHGGLVTVFARDPGTGALTFVEATGQGGSDIALSTDDQFVLVPLVCPSWACSTTCGLHVFQRTPGLGTLTPFPFACTVGESLQSVAVTDDGLHAYVADQDDFFRLRTLRMSDFRQRSEVDGAPTSIDVASDGAFVFTGRAVFNRVTHATEVFRRNPSSGQLRQLPVELIGGSGDVASSPDRRHLYTTGNDAVYVHALTPCGLFVSRSKVVLTKTGTDPDPSDDRLVVKADFIATTDLASVDPSATGAHGHIEDATGATVVDFTLPSGSFGGAGTRGWKSNAAGTTWKYIDKTGAPIAGIARVVLKDLSQKTPRMVGVRIKGKDSAYPVDTANLPLDVSLEIGGSSLCALSGFAPEECAARSSTKVTCKSQ